MYVWFHTYKNIYTWGTALPWIHFVKICFVRNHFVMNPHKSEEESLSEDILARTHFVKKQGGRNLVRKPTLCMVTYILYTLCILYMSPLCIFIPVFYFVCILSVCFILYILWSITILYIQCIVLYDIGLVLCIVYMTGM